MSLMLLSLFFYGLQLSPGSFPRPLTAREEQHYLALAGQGDREARNILIERNLRLVAHVMKKYYASGADQEDLISIGTVGLIKAVETFNPAKSIRLATYASRCVENPKPSLWRWDFGGAMLFAWRIGTGLWRAGFRRCFISWSGRKTAGKSGRRCW